MIKERCMKKGMLFTLILLVCFGSAFGGPKAESDSGGKESLTVWVTSDSPEMRAQLEKFKGQNPDIDFSIVFYPSEDLKTQLRLAVDSKTTPDIFYVNAGTMFQDFYRTGALADLTDIVRQNNLLSHINPDYIKPYTIDGKYYAFPGAPLTVWMALYVNRDIFAQAGITKDPATYSELLQTAAKLRSAGVAPLAIGDKDGWPAILLMGDFFAQQVTNMSIINAINSGRDKFTTNREIRRAFETVVNLGKAGVFMNGFVSQDHTAGIQTFAAGRAAMLYNGSWWTGVAGGTDFGFKLDVITLPLLDGLTEGRSVQMSSDMAYAVNPASIQKASVAKFLNYASSEESSIISAQGISAFAIYPGANEKVKLDPVFRTQPILSQFSKPSLAPFFDWVFPTPVTEILKVAIQQTIQGTITVDQALVQLQAEMDKNLNTMSPIAE
jgi:raffinose/stachyose/melibiose transport system substrate-binding protein